MTPDKEPDSSSSALEAGFDCIILNPGKITVSDKIGTFFLKDSVTRRARCLLKDGVFSLHTTDSVGVDVELFSVPAQEVDRVTYAEVPKEQQVLDVVKSHAAYSAATGVLIALVIFWQLRERGELTGAFFLIFAAGVVVVFALGGALLGWIKGNVGSESARSLTEYRLEKLGELLVGFRVEPSQSQSVSRLIQLAGWLPRKT